MNNTFNITLNNNGNDIIFVSINGGKFNEYKPDVPVQVEVALAVPTPPHGVINDLITLGFAGDEDGQPLLGSSMIKANYTQNGGQVIDEQYTLDITQELTIEPFGYDVDLTVNTESDSPFVLSQNKNNNINILVNFSQS